MQPRTLALISTLLPIVTVHIAYFISASQELVSVCNPYIDGCTSISRAARKGDALFVFRPLMIVDAVCMMLFWQLTHDWLSTLTVSYKRTRTSMCWIGIVGAVFLILYANFLGFDGEMYQLMRRFGVTIFFSFTALAQMLQVNVLTNLIKDKCLPPLYQRTTHIQTGLCGMMLILGISNVTMKLAGLASDQSENIIEWNFGLIMALFYLGNAFLWHKTQYRTVHTFDP